MLNMFQLVIYDMLCAQLTNFAVISIQNEIILICSNYLLYNCVLYPTLTLWLE